MTNRTWRDTVFRNQKVYAHPNERLAITFHRASVVMYLLFAIWGIASLRISLPAMMNPDFRAFDDWFSIYIIPASLAAAVGATYFPRMARLEMFSAGALVGLVSVFLGFVAWEAIVLGSDSAARNIWIDIALVVIPVSRIIIIFGSLVRAADQEGT